MQTFLPYPSFYQSAWALDQKRLGKQRVEAKQILMIITGDTKHWKRPNAWCHHPAVLMWVGYEYALRQYGEMICRVWIERGCKDRLLDYFTRKIPMFEVPMPPWLGNPKLHKSHQSNLIAKYPDWYSQFDWDVEPGRQYWWPRQLPR